MQPGKYDTQYSVQLYEVAKITKPANPSQPVKYRLRKRGKTAMEAGNFTMRDVQTVPVDANGNPVQHAVPKQMAQLDETS
eukprot:COSAG01_NODE_48112_length_384_cov_0.550877_1_plen_79_part_10